ncbi:MAG: peptidoglycan DD-metalloendopeptidase family protein [Bacteroidales bacterium]
MIQKRLPEIALIIALVILMWLITGRSNNPTDQTVDIQKTDTTQAVFESCYGIRTDSLIVEKHLVKPGQNLSSILNPFGVSMSTIDQLAQKSKDIFDVRKVKAGNTYTVLCRGDSTNMIQYFIYEKTATDYIVYDLRDSVIIKEGQKAVSKKLKQAAGTINNSLWMSMKEGGFNPFIAIRLSEIYAWTIDFFAIEKGDQYSVIYEQLYVEGEPIGLGKIHAAWFMHSEKPFYAFYFEQDTIGDYFDEEANSLRKTFLKAPLRFSRISSRFSHSRMHPILKYRRPHHGVDYAAPTGTPVHAVGDGKILKANYSGGAGHYVKIRHNGTYTTAYMHLSKYGKGIKAGKHVKQGDIIGYVGSTGLSTGPHLDFRFYRNGSPVDPLKVESPPAEPVSPEHLERYQQHLQKWKAQLDEIQLPEEESQEITKEP